EVDRYLSDPTAFEDAMSEPDPEPAGAPDMDTPALTPEEIETLRGRPERFADLLPAGTEAAEFAQTVLRPGWWEERDAGIDSVASAAPDEEDGDLVDEVDRARCMGLALELWAPDEYPLAGDLEDVPNLAAGPAIALAWR
ncbi:MAG: hypothetical protein ACRDID_16890, partial [Ktedonobacterales bacterium]